VSVSTNVPPLTITDLGVQLPAQSDILDGALADINVAFGGDLNTTNLETPQGQIASSLTAVIGDVNDQFAQLVANVDPATSTGVFQDGIARIYFLERLPALSTVVTVTCSGLPNVSIPLGAQVQDANGNIYYSTSTATIGSGSAVDVQFAAINPGPVACPAGSITGHPYNALGAIGWDSATNAADGVIGRDVESPVDFEYRRKNSVALNAHGSPAAIKAAVLNVAGVLDCYVQDNPTGSSANYGATSKAIAAHAVYVSVVGGANTDIATAIWSKKDLGCDMVGSVTTTVYDTEGYSTPYPSYSIKHDRPSGLAIKMAVTIKGSTTTPTDAITQIKAAVISAFSGGDGLPRARVGSTVYASRYYSPVAMLSWSPLIVSIKIGTSTATLDSVNVGIDQVPGLASADISVTIT